MAKKKGGFAKILAALGIGAAAGATAAYMSNKDNRAKAKAKATAVKNTAVKGGKKVAATTKSTAKKVEKIVKK